MINPGLIRLAILGLQGIGKLLDSMGSNNEEYGTRSNTVSRTNVDTRTSEQRAADKLREKEEREQAYREQKRLEAELVRQQEIEIFRLRRLEQDKRRERLLWWKRYGWIIALALILVSVAMVQKAKNRYVKYKEAEAEERMMANHAGFVIKDKVIKDTHSGLIWTRNANIAGKQMNWNDATDYVKQLNYSGYSDWRLPTEKELKDLATLGGEYPYTFLNDNGFHNVRNDFYWSSDIYSSKANFAWAVSLSSFSSSVGFYGDVSYKYNVWPVRAGL